jgi:hypothetical protein
MNSRIGIALFAVLLIVLLVPNLCAQQQLLFRVDVPFEFIVEGVHMPAGQYLAFHSTPSIIQLVRVDGRASAWVNVKASSVQSGSSKDYLVFNCYGDTRCNAYFLAQIHSGGDQQVHECYRCRSEKTMMAQAGSSKVRTVQIAALKP